MKICTLLGLFILSLSSKAVASEYLDETYYRCGDASGTGVGNFVSLDHVKGPMDRVPSWGFSYSTRMHDPGTGYSKTVVDYCRVNEVVQVADGYDFKGAHCEVKVLQSGDAITSIQFNHEAAIAGCKWDSDDSGNRFNQSILTQSLSDEAMPLTPATK